MAEDIIRIDVVATIAYHGDKLLTVFNSHWGSFTVPQTKLRNPQFGLGGKATRWERGAEAAMRNVGEYLGVTSLHPPGLLLDIGQLQQSDRTGKINHYHFQIYGFPAEAELVASGVAAAWLTPEELLDLRRGPISPTARAMVAQLNAAQGDHGGHFPPKAAPPRKSVASIAVIKQQQRGQPVWLTQWNPKWGRYFLVGGHQKTGETPLVCMGRELGEELHLGADSQPHARSSTPASPQPLRYRDWSTSAWQDTDYEISCFDVTLSASALTKVNSDPANRWLTAPEIRSERCADGHLISPTARKVLRLLGEM